ncbi:MAG: polysaccharide biosynthesis tyrosine autokinase [Terracidiphilus sp.]|jgi:succinoglycan biosynthesis transport protein ExoP
MKVPVVISTASSLLDTGGSRSDALTLHEIVRVLRKHALLIVVCILLSAVCSFVYLSMVTPLYESVGSIEIDPNRSSMLGLADMLKMDDDTTTTLKTEVEVLRSNAVAVEVLRNLDSEQLRELSGGEIKSDMLNHHEDSMDPKIRASFFRSFEGSMTIEVVPETRIIKVRFRHHDAKLCAIIVNKLLESYMQRNLSSRYTSAKMVSDWLGKQMDDIRATSDGAQGKLVDFQQRNGLVGVDDSDNIVTEKLKILNEQLTEAEADRIVKEVRYHVASSGNPDLISNIVPTTELTVLRTQQAGLQGQIAEVSSKFGPNYPKLGDLQVQLVQVNGLVATQIATITARLEEDLQTAQATERGMRAQFEKQKQETLKLTRAAGEYYTLKHDVESSQGLYDLLQIKLKEAGITAGLSSVDELVLDQATTPAWPAWPKKMQTALLSVMLGLVVGIVITFVAESLDHTLYTIEDLENSCAAPLIAIIPKFQGALARARQKLPGEKGIDGFFNPMLSDSPEAEAFRSMCSSVLFSSLDAPFRSLLVTSPQPADGKSSIATNFAITMAQRHSRVLLVDADLRRPTLHRSFKVRQTPGLSSLLLGDSSEEEAILSPLPEVPTLFFLPAGPLPPYSAETLGTQRLRDLVETWKSKYDLVIFDSSPILSVAEVSLLARTVAAVILVTRSGQTPRKSLRRAISVLSQAKATILGVVLNSVTATNGYYYSYYGSLESQAAND